jgi:hypothetical protein
VNSRRRLTLPSEVMDERKLAAEDDSLPVGAGIDGSATAR